MRTTVVIDDDVLSIARHYAGRRRVSLGAALSELARLGSEQLPKFKTKNGFPQLSYQGREPLTSELVARLLDDEA